MLTLRSCVRNLYVDHASQQWIVLDTEGNLWVVPGEELDPWERRQPFNPTQETELELVPGHYKHMLGLPV